MQHFAGSLPPRTRLLILIEHLLVVVSVAVAVSVRTGAFPLDLAVIWRASLVAAVLQLCFHFSDLYDPRRFEDQRSILLGLIQATGAASFILAFLYLCAPGLIIGHGVVVLASGVMLALVSGWRVSFAWVSMRLKPGERLLIVGTAGAAIDLARELYDRRQELGVELVGFVDTDPARVGTSLINPGVIGIVQDIPRIVRDRHVDRVVVSLADARGKLSMDQLLEMKLNDGVRFDHLASVYEEYTGKIAVENLRPSWLVFSEGFARKRWVAVSKRSFDFVLAVAGLLLTAPLLIIVAILVRMTSPGPALYRQVRVGLNGKPFTIVKFRSMRSDAEAATGAVWATADDPRVTRLGRFLRRTRIDELPQLLNVLKGDMSFVGPRPERPEFVSDLTKQIPFYGQRHVIRPGVTGWAQVRHAYGSTVEDALQKLQYELYYIKHASPSFDLVIFFETIKTVLVRRGS